MNSLCRLAVRNIRNDPLSNNPWIFGCPHSSLRYLGVWSGEKLALQSHFLQRLWIIRSHHLLVAVRRLFGHFSGFGRFLHATVIQFV